MLTLAQQVEAAWRQHEPRRAMVPYAARRAADEFAASLEGGARRVRATYESMRLRRLLNEWARVGALERDRNRALRSISAAIAPARLVAGSAGRQAFAFSWLEASGPWLIADGPEEVGSKQDCVLAVIAVVSKELGRRREIRADAFPTLAVSTHALRRLIQRARIATDLTEAIGEALHCFLASDYEETRRAGTLCLPGAGGLFLCNVFQTRHPHAHNLAGP